MNVIVFYKTHGRIQILLIMPGHYQHQIMLQKLFRRKTVNGIASEMQLVLLLLRALREPLKCEYTQQQNKKERSLCNHILCKDNYITKPCEGSSRLFNEDLLL